MMEAVDGYIATLEEKVGERTAELANAKVGRFEWAYIGDIWFEYLIFKEEYLDLYSVKLYGYYVQYSKFITILL